MTHSYHDPAMAMLREGLRLNHLAIQGVARAIEAQRSLVYSQAKAELIAWDQAELAMLDEAEVLLDALEDSCHDAFELEWWRGAAYKVGRIRNHTRSREKAADDAVDAYNYLGLILQYWSRNARQLGVPVRAFALALGAYDTLARLFSVWASRGVVARTSEELQAAAAVRAAPAENEPLFCSPS